MLVMGVTDCVAFFRFRALRESFHKEQCHGMDAINVSIAAKLHCRTKDDFGRDTWHHPRHCGELSASKITSQTSIHQDASFAEIHTSSAC